MIYSEEGFEEEQMSNLGCENVSDLIAEVKRLREEVHRLSVDAYESVELILDAHHPEVKGSVLAMFGDAIANNWPSYDWGNEE